MIIPQDKHIEFYEWQIQVLEDEWERYAKSPMRILMQEKRLFVGRIWGVQEEQGNVILRFKAGVVPRMKQPYLLCLVGSDAPQDSSNWNFNYTTFRESQSPRLSGRNTDIYTQYYLKSNHSDWSYIAVNGFDSELLLNLKENFLSKQQHPLIVIAETDPPIDYLLKLKEYVASNGEDSILNLDVDKKEDSWNPINIDNEAEILQDVVDLIHNNHTTIIQGPPGTGKSYLAAQLSGYFLEQNYAVAVTALTNRALIEIAEKKGLDKAIGQKKVYKTNLSNDELKKLPSLQNVKSFSPINGELLLTTYYKLSQFHSEIIEGSKRFDLLIIEEASQSYLATIAMFSSIAKKVLVIGDHKQLMPVVIRRDQALKIHIKINGIIDGLKTLAFNNSDLSYRLTKTRRLTSVAAKLTGLYYDNKLSSISDLEGEISLHSKYSNLFQPNGGVSIVRLQSSRIGFLEEDIIKLLCKIANELMKSDKSLEVALLSPYIKIESAYYEQYSKLSTDYSHMTINTIHKIQGLTTDLTLHYMPLDNPGFDLDDNLFNVATSRSRMGTLLVTYEHIRLLSSVSTETLNFLHSCMDVTDIFKTFLAESR